MENKSFKNNKLIFLLSLAVTVFLIFLYLNAYILHWDFVLIGVFHELLIIPFWIGELVLLFFSIRGFILTKYSLKSYSFLATIILLVNILLTWSSFADMMATSTVKSAPLQVRGLSGITAIAGGGRNSIVLCNDSTVKNWGYNRWFQLGDGTNNTTGCLCKYTPVKVSGLTSVIELAGGMWYSLALKNDGTVWAWGLNNTGQLGDGTTTERTIPIQVSGLTGITTISAGGWHSLALKNDGTVWAWGSNGNYQLGDLNYTTCKSIPIQVSSLTEIKAIKAQYKYSLALKNDGTVWLLGQHNKDQLWGGVITHRTPMQVSGLTDIIAITGGQYHSLALKKDGTLWAWGENSEGQLGDGTTTDRNTPIQVIGITGITTIAGGDFYSLALKKDGTVWAWGENNTGQLGDGTTTDRTVPVQVTGLTGIKAIVGGGSHSLALKNDGTVWAWGWNDYGQLGSNVNDR